MRTALIFICVTAVAACRLASSPESSTKITNGIEINRAEFPEVVEIAVRSGGGTSRCTATFVSDSVLLTATHCFGRGTNANAVRFVDRNGTMSQPALRLAINPGYYSGSGTASDIAFVEFAAGSSPVWARVATHSPVVNTPVTMIGFGNFIHALDASGNPNGNGSGKKRVGRNIIASVGNGLVRLNGVMQGTGDGADAGTSQGDSGGPLFANNLLIATVSSGYVTGRGSGQRKHTNYVDLTSAASKDFIKRQQQAGMKISLIDDMASIAAGSTISNAGMHLSLLSAEATGNAANQYILASVPSTHKDVKFCAGKLSADACLAAHPAISVEVKRSDTRTIRRSVAAFDVQHQGGYFTIISQTADDRWLARTVQIKSR